MEIFTLNVGQGQFVVITGDSEALIVDTFIPLAPVQPIINVKSSLAKILKNKFLTGLIITGFDSDHFNQVGLRIVLNKYRPEWIMYPKYYKKSKTASYCFEIIEEFEGLTKITKHSVILLDNSKRFYNKLSKEFKFEIFSPHMEDMTSSNNCSLVCKVTERTTKGTYLITGDTECDRWDSIVEIFGDLLESDVLAAPHHGSDNGITEEAMDAILPIHVIISAGVNNKHGHPDSSAMEIFENGSKCVFSTNDEEGQSLYTIITPRAVKTIPF